MKYIGKHILPILLVAFLLLPVLRAQAAPAATISAEALTAAPGEDVSVLFQLENNPGINALKLQISYDSSVLILKSVTDKNLFGSAPTKSRYLTDNPYNLIWATAGNATESGALVELTFHVSETAAAGTQVISVTADSVFDENENAVSVIAQNAAITISKNQTTEIRQITAGDKIQASVYLESGKSARALCALYAPDGKMLAVQFKNLKAGAENALTFESAKGAHTVKIIVLQTEHAVPLCPAATQTLP